MLSLLLTISIGFGTVDEEFGKHRENPVGIIEIEHPYNGYEVGFFHASGLLNDKTDKDHGINIFYIKKRIYP